IHAQLTCCQIPRVKLPRATFLVLAGVTCSPNSSTSNPQVKGTSLPDPFQVELGHFDPSSDQTRNSIKPNQKQNFNRLNDGSSISCSGENSTHSKAGKRKKSV